MTIANQVLLTDYTKFCQESLKWCSSQSEEATQKVGDILNLLLQDAQRISAMSKDSLEVLANLKEKISTVQRKKNTTDLVKTLRDFCQQDVEVSKFVSPVIETLQFQDKVRQNMENLTKMLNVWTKLRRRHLGATELTNDILLELGQEFLKATTMKEERDVIRSIIPSLPDEEEVEDVMMF